MDLIYKYLQTLQIQILLFKLKKDCKPYNSVHLDAMYDLMSNVYTDAVVCKIRKLNEQGSLVEMVDRADDKSPAIVIADRGSESYNVLAHIQEKNWKFLIRVKDLESRKSGILGGFDLPDKDIFDMDVDLNLTYKQTNEAKELLKDKNRYRQLKSDRRFDYLPKKNKKHEPLRMYNLKFRIVRFKLTEDSYEVILTNLDKAVFPPTLIKELYSKRWGNRNFIPQIKIYCWVVIFSFKKGGIRIPRNICIPN